MPARSDGDTQSVSDAFGPAFDETLPTIDPERYLIHGERARGGNGRILAATEGKLGRLVAIKELLDGGADREARFVREAQLTARLQHPAIVPVYDVGRWPSGKPMFVMKLIEGGSLRDAIRARATLDDRLALLPHMVAITEAVAYAHGRGIIHRDLKPSNVLVGTFGETVVIDWGLAKEVGEQDARESGSPEPRIDGTVTLTKSGDVVGTPAFMSPEQARGDTLDFQSDVYSLGAILYMLLTGHEPYRGASASTIIAAVIAGPPEDVARLEPGSPPELVTIARRAMARNAADRYRSASELRDDLSSFLRGQLVRAHRYSSAALLRRFIARNRAAVIATLTALTIIGAIGTVALRRVLAERRIAEARARELLLQSAESAVDRDPTEAVAWLKSLQPVEAELARARDVYLDALSRGVALGVWRARRGQGGNSGADDQTKQIAFDAANNLLVVSRNGTFRLSQDARSSSEFLEEGADGCVGADGLDAWVVRDRDLQHWYREASSLVPFASGIVIYLACAPSGGRVAVATKKTIAVFDRAGRLERSIPIVGAVGTVVFSGEDRLVFEDDARGILQTELGSSGKEIASTIAAHGRLSVVGPLSGWAVYEATNQLMSTELAPGHTHPLEKDFGLSRIGDVWTADPRRMRGAAVGRDGLVWWRDFETDASFTFESPLIRFSEGAYPVPSGDRLAILTPDSIRLFDTKGAMRATLRGLKVALEGAWTHDHARFAGIDRDGALRVWLTDRFFRETVLTSSADGIFGLALSMDGRHIGAGAGDGRVWLWDRSTGKGGPLSGPSQALVADVAFSRDGHSLIALDWNGGLRAWNVINNELLWKLTLPSAAWRMTLSPDGERVVCAGHFGELYVVDLQTKQIRALAGHLGEVKRTHFSVRGELLSFGSRGITLVWDRTLTKSDRLIGHRAEVQAGAIASDGTAAATGDVVGAIWIWDLVTKRGQLLDTFSGSVASIQYAPDGETLFVGGTDGTLRGYRVRDRQRILTGTHRGGVRTLDVSRDGRRIASGGIDGTVRIWDVDTFVGSFLRGHGSEVRGLAFVPDGQALVSGALDGSVRVWNLGDSDPAPKTALELNEAINRATSAMIVEGHVRSP